MGETRVDLLHLLEDLRDAYPGSPEETILTEIVANSLDSGAGAVAFACDPTDTATEPPVLPGKRPKRPAHYGLAIKFESRPDHPELGRLVESTVWVNEAHPAYLRAAASRSEGYHLALAVALALAPLAVEPAQEHAFVTAFLARWGEEAKRK